MELKAESGSNAALTARSKQKSTTRTVLAINLAFFFVVAFFGFYSGSLVLLASAVHLVADVITIGLGYFAILLTSRPVSQKLSFGLVRAEVLAALINGTVLLATSAWILLHAIHDMFNPHPIAANPIIALGIIGLVISLSSVILLQGASGTSLNMKANLLHMASDAGGWFSTVLSGIAIAVFRFYRADAIGSVVISVLVLLLSWQILVQTVAVLLEATPRTIKPDDIKNAIQADQQILEVHHLHLWNLASDTTALSAHILMRDGATLHHSQTKVQEIKEMLKIRYGIDHVTIEIECHNCGDTEHDLDAQ